MFIANGRFRKNQGNETKELVKVQLPNEFHLVNVIVTDEYGLENTYAPIEVSSLYPYILYQIYMMCNNLLVLEQS